MSTIQSVSIPNTVIRFLFDCSTTTRAVTRSAAAVATLMFVVAGFMNDPLWAHMTNAMLLIFSGLFALEITERGDLKYDPYFILGVMGIAYFIVGTVPFWVFTIQYTNYEFTRFYLDIVSPINWAIWGMIPWLVAKSNRGFFALLGTLYASLGFIEPVQDLVWHLNPDWWDYSWIAIVIAMGIHYMTGWLVFKRPSMQWKNTLMPVLNFFDQLTDPTGSNAFFGAVGVSIIHIAFYATESRAMGWAALIISAVYSIIYARFYFTVKAMIFSGVTAFMVIMALSSIIYTILPYPQILWPVPLTFLFLGGIVILTLTSD